jgi:RHS repeat-associated protein
MTLLQSTSGGDDWPLQWDAENRLTEIANATTRIVNTFDSQHRRVRKQVYTDNTLVTDAAYLFDGWNLVAETISDPQSTHTNFYIWGADRDGSLDSDSGGVGGLLAIIRDTTVYYPVMNHHGDVMALIDDSGSNIVARYEYDPWGVLLSATGPAVDACPFRWQTKYVDAETGLYYFGYRFFDSLTGRWLSRDPLEEDGGVNLYAFCGNDPVNGVDPLGLVPGGGNAITMGPGLDFYPRGGWSNPLDDFEHRELSGLEAAGTAPALMVYVAMIPYAGNEEELYRNCAYYESPWLGFNATYNPMVKCLLSGDEAVNGVGIQPHNSGKELSTGERWWSAGRSGLAFGETALIAYGGAKLSAPHIEGFGRTAFHLGEGASYAQARAMSELGVMANYGTLDVAALNSRVVIASVSGTEAGASLQGNIAYRALNSKDLSTLRVGAGLQGKKPDGSWGPEEHILFGSEPTSWAHDPFIATTRDLDFAVGWNTRGVVAIDLGKVPSAQLCVWKTAPYRSQQFWSSLMQQEVTVYQSIPARAVIGNVR